MHALGLKPNVSNLHFYKWIRFWGNDKNAFRNRSASANHHIYHLFQFIPFSFPPSPSLSLSLVSISFSIRIRPTESNRPQFASLVAGRFFFPVHSEHFQMSICHRGKFENFPVFLPGRRNSSSAKYLQVHAVETEQRTSYMYMHTLKT